MRAILALSFVFCFSPLFAQSVAAPDTERVTDKVLRLTDALEKEPLSASAPDTRKRLVQWLTDTPDFSVTVCDILGPIPGKKLKYGPELMVQLLFGNVAYQIRNPGQKDEAVLQQAGVESVLKAYQAILAQDPKAHIKYFDDLLEKHRQGLLKENLAPLIAKECSP